MRTANRRLKGQTQPPPIPPKSSLADAILTQRGRGWGGAPRNCHFPHGNAILGGGFWPEIPLFHPKTSPGFKAWGGLRPGTSPGGGSQSSLPRRQHPQHPQQPPRRRQKEPRDLGGGSEDGAPRRRKLAAAQRPTSSRGSASGMACGRVGTGRDQYGPVGTGMGQYRPAWTSRDWYGAVRTSVDQ